MIGVVPLSTSVKHLFTRLEAADEKVCGADDESFNISTKGVDVHGLVAANAPMNDELATKYLTKHGARAF